MNSLLHPYVVTGYLTTLITIAVGLFVYFKNRFAATHKAFLLYSLSIAEWSFFSALHTSLANPESALFWGRLCHIGVLFIPVFFYYFSLKITGHKNRFLLVTGVCLAILIVLAIFMTPYFIPRTRHDVGLPNFVMGGPLYVVIIIFFGIYVSLSLTRLYMEIRHSVGARKKHLQYFFWASILGYGIGAFNYCPVYGLITFPYPYSALCGAIYSCIFAYAIVKHKLFDIELIIKKGLIFGLLFAVIYMAISLLVFLFGYFTTNTSSLILFGISILIAMLVYEPLKNFLTHLTQRFLFQKKTAYVDLIQSLTDQLTEVRDAQIISDQIVDFLSKQMSLDWAALYLKEYDSGFKLKAWRANEICLNEIELNTIINLMETRRTPLSLSPFDTEGDIDVELKTKLRSLRIEAIIPIFLEKSLFGIHLLGKKKSDDAYSREDEALLKTLMDETAMIFMSVKLLKDLNRAHLELGQRMKMSSLIHLSRGVHHEVRNPLHTISLVASAIHENIHKGRYRQIEKENVTAKIHIRIESMLEETTRIQNSLSRFAQFARPDKDMELIPLSLKNELEDFFGLMQEGQKLDSIKVENTVPEELFVPGTKVSLQEIFFNLFNNAYEAMEGCGELFVHAYENGDFIEFKFKDSGPGIPEEILPSIFEEYFTTKINQEAAGIGLAIVKHRIELLGGSIEVSSPLEEGATFHIKFRKREEMKLKS